MQEQVEKNHRWMLEKRQVLENKFERMLQTGKEILRKKNMQNYKKNEVALAAKRKLTTGLRNSNKKKYR